MKRLIVLLVFCCSFSMTAAPMVRVISVKDSHTVVVDNQGVAPADDLLRLCRGDFRHDGVGGFNERLGGGGHGVDVLLGLA